MTATAGGGTALSQTDALEGVTDDVRAARRRLGDICSVCIVRAFSKGPTVAFFQFAYRASPLPPRSGEADQHTWQSSPKMPRRYRMPLRDAEDVMTANAYGSTLVRWRKRRTRPAAI
ncbi:hypothetical protein [Mycobacterium sp. HNNTM2301]|uniref:hypothetical protein n=1 Tax=Mycobacterium hainanense TaxID=3289775 RepID=UPI0035A7467D